MVFRRRSPLSVLQRLRELVWPRMGFRRSFRYVGFRVLRLPGSAYAIAGGFAWGAAVSFTPFVGTHFILAALGAWLTRCNILASAIGTVIGNPWTFPFIWAFVYHVGVLILGINGHGAPALETLADLFKQIWALAGNWVLFIVGLEDTIKTSHSTEALLLAIRNIFWPMLVGSLPVGLGVWLLFYGLLKVLVESYQRRRRRRRRKRAEIPGMVDGDMPHI